jgi:hypothetical protein
MWIRARLAPIHPEEERALLEAIAQADRGQVVSWEKLREQLRRSA